jgi:hypothetical protein
MYKISNAKSTSTGGFLSVEFKEGMAQKNEGKVGGDISTFSQLLIILDLSLLKYFI